jgi:Protein of unknown function (DUF2934)
MMVQVAPMLGKFPDPQGPFRVNDERILNAMAITRAAIAHRAYEKFIARGSVHGFDQEDWLTANDELVAEAIGQT